MRMLLLPAALTLAAALPTAGADKVGFFLLGAQYERDLGTTDSVRFGLGLPLAFASGDGGLLLLSGDVSYLQHPGSANGGSALRPYYGGGLGLFTLLASSGGSGGALIGVYPNVLGGANFAVNDRLEAFAEASAGPRVFFTSAGGSSSTSVEFSLGARLGLNYCLP